MPSDIEVLTVALERRKQGEASAVQAMMLNDAEYQRQLNEKNREIDQLRAELSQLKEATQCRER